MPVNTGWQPECPDPFVILLHKLAVSLIYSLKEIYLRLPLTLKD